MATVGARSIGCLDPGQFGDRVHAGDLHLAVDGRCADVERAAKDEREAEDVVDLVRVVGAPGTDHRVVAYRLDLVGQDLRVGVGQRHDHRARGHARDHLRLQQAARGEAQEQVRAVERLGQRAQPGVARVARLVGLRDLAPGVQHPTAVADQDPVARQAEVDQQVEAGDRRRAGTRGDQADAAELLADDLERVQCGGRDDDRGAVLVVVEHRDVEPLAQAALDLEALGRLDVLEVDGAEGRLEHLDEPVRITGVELDVEHVDAGELLEQDPLALHHRLGGQRPDRAEAEHRGTVGDHRDEVATRRDAARLVRVGDNRLAGRGDPRRVGQRQVALVGERLGGNDLEFPRRWLAMVFEGALAQVVTHGLVLIGSAPCDGQGVGLPRDPTVCDRRAIASDPAQPARPG